MNVYVKVLALDVEDGLVKGFQFNRTMGNTLPNLVLELSSIYPLFKKNLADDSGQLLPSIRVVINNRVADDINITVRDGSKVVFFPAIVGG